MRQFIDAGVLENIELVDRDLMKDETTVPLAAMRAAIDAIEPYVPYAQRENARAAALAASIGYGYPKCPTCGKPHRGNTRRCKLPRTT